MFAWSKHECSPARFPEYLRNESSKIHEYKGATHNNLIVWKIVKLWNFMHVLSLDHVGIFGVDGDQNSLRKKSVIFFNLI